MKLSFIVPCHISGAPLVLRFLQSLRAQTAPFTAFDVILGCDGGGAQQMAELVKAQTHPFKVHLVDSPRPKGDFPHRNHARNAALRKSKGWLSWIVDADFVWDPKAVEHAIAVHEAAAERGALISVTPILMAVDEDPRVWLGMTEEWARTGDPAALKDILDRVKIKGGEYSGFEEKFRPSPDPSTCVSGLIPEGFPCVRRDVLKALRGFDERFMKWGGNKEELCRRLVHLERDVLEVRLLNSVRALHQPHPADRAKRDDDVDRKANQRMFIEKRTEILSGAQWWEGQVARVKRVKVAPVKKDDVDPASPRIGIVTVNDERKGLWRDTRILSDILTTWHVRPGGRKSEAPVLFPIEHVQDWAKDPMGVRSVKGQSFADFVASVDVVIVGEFLVPQAFNYVLGSKKRLVYIPNADWAERAGSVQAWLRTLRKMQEQHKGLVVVAKTPKFHAVLTRQKIRSHSIPWTVTDRVVRDRTAPQSGPVTFLASLGNGGWHERRGADVLAKAWALVKARVGDKARLVVKTISPIAQIADRAEKRGHLRRASAIRSLPGIADELHTGMWGRRQLRAAHDAAHVLLYPTRWDGYGLSLREALHQGLPVIASDAWPMNEQVEDGVNGLLIQSNTSEVCRLAPHAEPDPAHLAKQMIRLINDRKLLQWLTAPEPGLLVAQQHAFAIQMRALLLAERPPRVVVFGGKRDKREDFRSEQFWAKALELHGYHVDYVEYGTNLNTLKQIYDFGIVSKAPLEQVETLRRVIRAPVICWHHDLVAYKAMRIEWFGKMIELVDLAAIPEDGCERFRGARAKVVTLMPGAKTYGPRGLGMRPDAPAGAPARVVFLGGIDGKKDERIKIISALLSAKLPLDIYGERWGEVKIAAGKYRGGQRAQAINRAAGIALCVSRGGHDTHYTSNRLFNAAAAGALPLVRDFPGLDRLYPKSSGLAVFGSTDAVAPTARDLLQSPENTHWRALAAQRHTFRYHTWPDRIAALLSIVRRKVDFASVPSTHDRVRGTAEFGNMWEARAKKAGRKGVGHISWSNAEMNASTKEWWARLRRQLEPRLKQWDRRVLDYGCGWGRFAQQIAMLPNKSVVGVDLSPTMLRMAKESRDAKRGFDGDLTFKLIKGGTRLPFKDDSFDCLWTCTVLQHVPDAEFALLRSELLRIMKPDAVFLLFENTDQRKGGRTSTEGHVVFRTTLEYRQAFPGCNVVDEWDVNGETHSVLAGRRSR